MHPPAGRPRPAATIGQASAPDRPRPGWTEIVVGLVTAAVLAVGLVRLATAAGVGPVAFGIFMTALSAIAAGGGFAAAALVRVRSLGAFGVRGTTVRWVLVGLAAGVVAFVCKFPAIAAYVALTGDAGNPQESWNAAASTGVATTVMAFLFLGVLTPIGEELLFRGVLATALLRYGAVVGVVGSSLVFAVLHGDPSVMLAGLIVGLIAGELRRRTGSVWPGVTVHMTFNLLSNVLALLVLPALAG